VDRRTLRYIGLARNRITMHACIVLAAGMRVTRALDRLALDGNPVGLDGGAAILETLARGYVSSVSLQDCNLSHTFMHIGPSAQGVDVNLAFDVQRPNRVYKLNLENASDYNLAATLVQYWAHDKTGSPWKRATLGGKVWI
jgi:hypothetical protein